MWCGVKTIVGIVGAVLAVTHGVLLNERASRLGPTLRRVAFWVVHAEAALALLCLERILRGDPGVIKRTPATTRPVPRDVADRIRSGRSLDDLTRNITDPRRGSYCVRCLVWRDATKKCHHCRVCARCVVDFDHHCGFYGRCIAGTSRSGNMPYFVLIGVVGYAALFTVIAFLVLSRTRWGAS